jgi:hypothetical protein
MGLNGGDIKGCETKKGHETDDHSHHSAKDARCNYQLAREEYKTVPMPQGFTVNTAGCKLPATLCDSSIYAQQLTGTYRFC